MANNLHHKRYGVICDDAELQWLCNFDHYESALSAFSNKILIISVFKIIDRS